MFDVLHQSFALLCEVVWRDEAGNRQKHYRICNESYTSLRGYNKWSHVKLQVKGLQEMVSSQEVLLLACSQEAICA